MHEVSFSLKGLTTGQSVCLDPGGNEKAINYSERFGHILRGLSRIYIF